MGHAACRRTVFKLSQSRSLTRIQPLELYCYIVEDKLIKTLKAAILDFPLPVKKERFHKKKHMEKKASKISGWKNKHPAFAIKGLTPPALPHGAATLIVNNIFILFQEKLK